MDDATFRAVVFAAGALIVLAFLRSMFRVALARLAAAAGAVSSRAISSRSHARNWTSFGISASRGG